MNTLDKGDTTRSVLALLFSLSPFYFLLQAKSRLGLDGLHLGLLQVLLLILLRAALNFEFPRWSRRTKSKVGAAEEIPTPAVAPEQRATTTAVAVAGRERRSKKAKAPSVAPPANSLFPVELLDGVLFNFLQATEPAYTPLIASQPSKKTPLPAALSEWTSLFTSPSVDVLQHPSTKGLYAIRASFPDVPLRKLFEMLVTIEKRQLWDGMTQATERIEEFTFAGRRGAVAWLGMKGMALVKPKDMCLLSVVAQLPPPKDEPPRIRIVCASSSFNHPKCPPKPAFNRMELSVSGFLVEEVGTGSKITQLTDLSGLGSWVPSAVIRTVTQTMIPKSLTKLAKVANEMDLSESKYEGDSWLPPTLGSFQTLDAPTTSLSTSDDIPDEEGAEDGTSDSVPSSQGQDMTALVGQLRVLSKRLNALEERGVGRNVVGQEHMSLGTKVGLVGGAMAAAGAVALVAAWNRRRK